MKLHVVLVRTEYSSNIGSAMRAMSNMGGDRLILIDPQCELDVSARQMAAGSASQLADVVRYASWQEFYAQEGDGIRIALTRRGGRNRKVIPLKEKAAEIATDKPGNLYLIFGPEADGLNQDDLAYVNHACHLPVHGSFASLNLAQAVLLACFVVRESIPADTAVTQFTGNSEEAIKPFYFPDDLIKNWLMAMGFDVKARRSSAYLTLRRLFLQNSPTQHEYQVLEAILQQNIRKLRGEKANDESLTFSSEQLTNDHGDVSGE